MSNGSLTKAKPKNGRSRPNPSFSAAELASLAGQWRSHRKNSLELRHRTGMFLNHILGDPRGRLKYGGETMEKVEAKLGISKSELNRMRWFAGLYANVAEFKRRFPELGTWTCIKRELPNLKAGNGKRKRSASKNRSAKTVYGRLARSLEDIAAKLSQLKELSRAERRLARTTLREKVLVLCKRLDMTVSVYK